MEGLRRLADTDPAGFERERGRIIAETLGRSQNRASCVELQAQLDLDRARLGPDAFMQSLTNRLGENVERLRQLQLALAAVTGKAEMIRGVVIR